MICVNGIWQTDNGELLPTAPIQQRTKDVPLVVAQEAYKEYTEQFGTSQSLERINERGGFGATELMILLYQRIKRLELKSNHTAK